MPATKTQRQKVSTTNKSFDMLNLCGALYLHTFVAVKHDFSLYRNHS
jgi:hypothetical protein